MIKAVIFDMYETLITHYHEQGPLYFSKEMSEDARIPLERFQAIWRGTEKERSTGLLSLEGVIERILKENNCYSEEVFQTIIHKRILIAENPYSHLHPEILPMLAKLKENGLKIGLISNCFSEEAEVIRRSSIFPYFDAVCLSYELGVQKPDAKIFEKCVEMLQVKPEECIYIGDGGSNELEASKAFGMTAMQATWYLKEGTFQPSKRKAEFVQLENPLDVLKVIQK